MSGEKEKEAAGVVVSKMESATPGVSKTEKAGSAEEARRGLFPKRKRPGLYRRTGEGAMIACYDKRCGAGRGLYEDDGIDGLYYEGTEGWN